MARNYVTTVRQNDTLQSIAHRFTKDRNKWNEIVAANSHLPKKTRMVNGRPLATLSDLFVGQSLVIPGHWFNPINPYTWDDNLVNGNISYGSFIVIYSELASLKMKQYAKGGPFPEGPFYNRIRNRWDRPMSVIAEYLNHPEWMNSQSSPFILPKEDDVFWTWFLKQIGITFNTTSTMCPQGFHWDNVSGSCISNISGSGIANSGTTGAIGCGSSCTAKEIREGNCKDFNMKQFMGVSGPPSDGSLGCGGGGCGGGGCGDRPNGCGYPFGPDQPGPVGNGCSSCGFDYLCDYPFGNGGSLCPMPYGAFGGGPNPSRGAINGVDDNGQIGCGACGRAKRAEFYLQGTVGVAPTEEEISAGLQKFIDMSPADCEKQMTNMVVKMASTPGGKTTYDALVKKYGSEEEVKARFNIAGQSFCGEPLKNINPQAPYKTTTGLLWLGGTLVGGIIAGVLVSKVL